MLRGSRLPVVDALRAATEPAGAVREAAVALLKGAHRLDRPPVGEMSREDLRAYEAVARLLDELDGWRRLDGELAREDVVAALERLTVWPRTAGGPGRVQVVDLMRARTRRWDVVFVLGLEEGSLPRRPPRRRSWTTTCGAASGRACSGRTRSPATATSSTPRARARRGASTSCVRRRPTRGHPARQVPSGRRSPRSSTATDVERWTRRRPLSALTWPLEGAPTDRERLRAVASLAAADGPAPRRRRSRAPTAGSAGSTARSRRAPPHAAPQPAGARAGRAGGRPSTSPSSSASPTAHRPGSSSVWSTRARSTPRSTPSCAAPSRTRRSTASSTASRRSSPPTGSTPRTWRRRSLHAAVPRRGGRGGVRMEMSELERRQLQAGPRATWKRSSGTRRRGRAASCRTLRGRLRQRALDRIPRTRAG